MADNDEIENTFMYAGPLFFGGPEPGPEHSRALIKLGSAALKKTVHATGEERFEHLVLYCLTLLHRAQGKICAFYLEDFPKADETTLRLVQELMGTAGYITSDFLNYKTKAYKGFWAWQKPEPPIPPTPGVKK